MDSSTLLADPKAIRLEKIIQHPSSLTLVVRATQPQAECPRCHRPSSRVHSYYTRTVACPPWTGVAARLHLRPRRFRCKNSLCTKRVFGERLPRVVAYYGRDRADGGGADTDRAVARRARPTRAPRPSWR